MIIAVDLSLVINEKNKRDEHTLWASIFFLAKKKSAHKFIIITRGLLPEVFPDLANVEIIQHDLLSKKRLLGNYWSAMKVKKVLKKIKADVLISFGKIYPLPVPQVLIANGTKIPDKRAINKSVLVIVNSIGQKNELVKRHDVAAEKIEIVPPVFQDSYKKNQEAEKDSAKARFTEGKEFFICTTGKLDEKSFLKLLKSFSHFKKRLQSGMKLILLTRPGKKLSDDLSSYKYRNDLVFAEDLGGADEALLIGSSYAVIIDATDSHPYINILKALKCGVPVISVENFATPELTDSGILYADPISEKGVGEKMIQLYTDENMRSKVIESGTTTADGFTRQKAMDCLWNCINKVVK